MYQAKRDKAVDKAYNKTTMTRNEENKSKKSQENENPNEECRSCMTEDFTKVPSQMISTNGSTGPGTYSMENSNISNMEAFLNQNLINFTDILKLIVVGDKSVGKSLFINRFISDSETDDRNCGVKYTPTDR